MKETLALIERAHQGDKEARDTLVEENIGLVWSIVRRFRNRGEDPEDLFQIGSIGLMKAIDHFNTDFEVKFSTYAVPMIIGEIKRFLRDDSMIKVSRGLKELAIKVYSTKDMLEKKMGREPTLSEVATEIGVPPEDVASAIDALADVESIHKTIYHGEGQEVTLLDKLEEKRDRNEELLNHMMVERAMEYLDERERQLLKMRYFEERTQSSIAKEMGMSQVQVSRMEKKILLFLREKI